MSATRRRTNAAPTGRRLHPATPSNPPRALQYEEGVTTASFYGSRGSRSSSSVADLADQNTCWQPGQSIPCNDFSPMVMHTPSPHNRIPTTNTPPNGSSSYVASLTPSRVHSQLSSFSGDQRPFGSSIEGGPSLFSALQTLQTSIDRQLTKVNDSVNNICVRLEKIEEKQSHFENDLKSISTTTAPSPESSSETGGTKRKRLTPTALQSKIHMVHNAFDEDKQFKTDESITSKHNSEVVQKIITDIGTDEFARDLIRRGCRTYRKTLAEKAKGVSTPVKKKKLLRSLKQRCYERRSKAIKTTSRREMKYWNEVTPDMMSDEEKIGDSYIRHPPSFRSERFNKFIQKLDDRLASMPDSHPRHNRKLGSQIEMSAPEHAKSWMIEKALANPRDEAESEADSNNYSDSSSDSDNED